MAIVCICMNVDETTLRKELNLLFNESEAFYDAPTSTMIDYLKEKTKASTGCGCCKEQLKQLVEEHIEKNWFEE